MTENYIEQFANAIRAAGLIPPDMIEPDGKLHRFASNGKRGDDAGWYVLHGDGIPAGSFGDWRTGLQQTWRLDVGRTLTPSEEAAHRAKVDAMQQAREAAKASEQSEAASKALAIWTAAQPAPADHPYLARKGIKSNGARLHKDALVIPMYADGAIHSLQFIGADGNKWFLSGGRVTGCYLSIGKFKNANALCIAEGFATGATIHEATGYPVAVAFNAGNLEPVATALRAKFPDLRLILCADDDNHTKGNPGLSKAIAAARIVDGLLAIPDFGTDRPDDATDFNDLLRHCDADAVKRAIALAAAPDIGAPQPESKNATGADPSCAEPEPLRATLPPAEPYPVAELGDILGGAANALHDAVKAPLALCCQSVLAAASLAAQALFDIRLPWGERKPLSLFLLTVGESGERKSGIDDLVLGAAKAQERADMAAYTIENQRYEADLAAWNQSTDMARRAAAGGKKGQIAAAEIRTALERCGAKPDAPIAPLRFVTDPTVEGLFKLFVVGQPSVALFSDEGGLLIGGHALNSDNALKTMARWCKLWDGSPFDRVRAGDGAGILYGRRMALHQLAQPDVMTELLSDRMANGQGLLARCLVAWPESTIGTRHVDRYEWAGDRPQLKRLFAVLKCLMEAEPRIGESRQVLDPKELPLSATAKDLAVEANNRFESLMAKGGDFAELRDRASKALQNACRVAGVFAVVEGGLAVREIDVSHLQRALVVVQWYLAESLRIRGAATVPQAVLDAELLLAWLKEKRVRAFRTKQVLNAGPNPLRNKPRLMAAIKELVVCGYLAKNEPGTAIDGVKARISWRVLRHVV